MYCVTDRNVWLDLYAGGLLAHAFDLPDEWVTTDLVLNEATLPEASLLKGLGLGVVPLSADLLAEVPNLAAQYPRPTTQDLSALLVAREKEVILLTGDQALRDAAEEEGVEVHGTLWVLDRMVQLGITPPKTAAAGLQAMVSSDRRLPKAEVNRRVAQWLR